MSQGEDREGFKRERDEVFATINKDQAEYDKQLLTLSSAFLAVSLAFIKDIVPLKQVQYLAILYTAFALLAFCIVLVLFSYQFSIWGNMKAVEYWDSQLAGDEEAEFPFAFARRVKWVNRLSGTLFAAGVCLTVIFVILNLHHEV